MAQQALLLQHLSQAVSGAGKSQEDTLISDIKHSDTPYTLPEYPLEKVVDKRPVGTLGQHDYMYCKFAEDCLSGICVKTSDSGTLKRCRPSDGFAVGRPCWYERDCDASKQNFCYHPETLKAVCLNEVVDYEACTSSAQCKSHRCALSYGLKCVDAEQNCRCAPEGGYKAGTMSSQGYYCQSGEVEMHNGIGKCT